MTRWTRVATGVPRTALRAKRARQRVKSGSTTGEYRKIDISETPDKEQNTEVSAM